MKVLPIILVLAKKLGSPAIVVGVATPVGQLNSRVELS